VKRPQPQDFFKDWKAREALAEAMIPLVGKLYRENNVSLYMYGRNMVNRSVTDLMKAHRFVRQVEHNELSEFDTFPMIEALAGMDLGQPMSTLASSPWGFRSRPTGARRGIICSR
jgi:glyceraldehyde 3-phosphate dehydrogenase